VAQKYIERPLLVLKRKFDIRQYVLATGWDPLGVWFYDICYVRFCSQDFSLVSFSNRFMHLSNNSVQKKAKKAKAATASHPIEGNMWSSTQFEEHLTATTGDPDSWKRIQTGMKRIAVASLKCVQGTVEHRKASMELFGYDFMVDEDLKPWLIEVNCSPTMEHSTPITTSICKDVMEDICKVVLDLEAYRRKTGYRALAKSAMRKFDTGHWTLAHLDKETPLPAAAPGALVCAGKKAPVHVETGPVGGSKGQASVARPRPRSGAPGSGPRQPTLKPTGPGKGFGALLEGDGRAVGRVQGRGALVQSVAAKAARAGSTAAPAAAPSNSAGAVGIQTLSFNM